MSSKQALLERMVHEPSDFTDADFLELVTITGSEAVTFEDLRENVRRIYDMNESSLLAVSDAMQGGLAFLNRMKQKERRKKFFARMRQGKRIEGIKNVVAEGDSWFCFPFYVKDINTWLLEDDYINLYSIAAAGDWITNMIYEGKYVEELSLIEPDVFLISGGGNDFVGSYRLSFMINKDVKGDLADEQFIKECVASRFYVYIWTLKTQYWLLLSSLKKAKKLKNLRIITQGYDHVIPFPKRKRGPDLVQWVINKATATGDWLCTPLRLKGLHDIYQQTFVLAHFIEKVNEMFISLATYPSIDGKPGEKYQFPNLYHVDCRRVARNFHDWFDEIHLKSDRFWVIAQAYKHLIFGDMEVKKEVPKLSNETWHQPSFDPDRKVIKAISFDYPPNK